jgi:hypothetical protein
MKRLVVASHRSTEEQEKKLLDIASWMGVPGHLMRVEDEAELVGRASAEAGPGKLCLALSADTLAGVGQSERLRNFLRAACEQLLVFGVAGTASHSQALQWLTRDMISVTPMRPSADASVCVSVKSRPLSHQLAGVTFTPGDATRMAGVDVAATVDVDVILSQGGVPAFARVGASTCPVFVSTDLSLPDIHAPVSAGAGIGHLYDGLIPPLIFLRHAFGDACWRGPGRTARVIIDDPLLRKRYGFLDFARLAESMKRRRAGTTIAFIPWNYRRTSPRMASMFTTLPSTLSICIHGCDHTSNEFGITDEDALRHKARLALDRMDAHESRTAIPFERVMVFPQGRFSAAAVDALRASGYLAAVDSGCIPTVAGQRRPTVAEFLRPAIQFHGFPVFKRHYPRRLIDFAFDLFLGKPALAVEHHAYFHDGGASLERLVEDLQGVEPDLTWPTLTSQLTRTCVIRHRSRRDVDVEFYTREFSLQNSTEHQLSYSLCKQEPDPARIARVLVDGVAVPFVPRDGGIGFDLDVSPGRVIRIAVEDRGHTARGRVRVSAPYRMKVGLRRFLSELRDEGMARHPGVMRAATRLTRAFGV